MPFHNLKYTDIHMFSRIRAWELCMTPGAGGTTLSCPTLTSGVRTQFICGDTFYVSDVSRSGRWGTEAASHNNTTRQPPPGKPRKQSVNIVLIKISGWELCVLCSGAKYKI